MFALIVSFRLELLPCFAVTDVPFVVGVVAVAVVFVLISLHLLGVIKNADAILRLDNFPLVCSTFKWSKQLLASASNDSLL